MLKTFLVGLFAKSVSRNRKNILELVSDTRPTKFLDLGCDEGTWTLEVAKAAGAKQVYGVEIVEERALQARAKSVEVTIADMAKAIPLPTDEFDLIHANQVIEHVPEIDLFAEEIFRLLKPGGSVVVSTENGSSWHNVFAAALGWQIFSLTNLSFKKAGIGNPLALHRNEDVALKSWTHKVIFNYRGLREFFLAHGFVDIQIKGAGYYPLPAIFGAWDPRHSHFITIHAKKPASRTV